MLMANLMPVHNWKELGIIIVIQIINNNYSSIYLKILSFLTFNSGLWYLKNLNNNSIAF